MVKSEIKCCGIIVTNEEKEEEKITNNEDLFNENVKIMSKMRLYKF